MADKLKSCPFCGSKPKLNVRAYYWPPTCYVSATVFCAKCKCNTNNSAVRKEPTVSQSIFWTDEEIMKHLDGTLHLYNREGDLDPTTARAAKAAARQLVIQIWNTRDNAAKAAGGE